MANLADVGREFQYYGLTAATVVLHSWNPSLGGALPSLDGPVSIRVVNPPQSLASAVITVQESDTGTGSWTTGYSNGNSGTGVAATVTVVPGGQLTMVYMPSKPWVRLTGTISGVGSTSAALYFNMPITETQEKLDYRTV